MERSKLSLTTTQLRTLILAVILMLPGIALGAKYFDDTFSSTFRSNGSNIATSGVLRLGNTETMGWRNFANGGNLLLSVDSSDRLLFNGVLIGTATAGSFQDSTFNIYDDGDATKKIAFQASGIGTTQTRTITMPNADVDLGGLTNSNIASGAGITYSKLSLTGGIVNADVSGSAAIAYSKLNLGSSIVNADIAAAAGIGVTKLAALTASRPVITDGSGFLTTEATLSPIRGGIGLNASASSGLLKFAIGTPSISSGQVVNADVAAAAGIGRTKMEALTANRVVITDASGFDTTEASLAISRGGTGNAGIGTTAGAVVYMDGSKMAATGIGTTGQVLISNGGAAPTWGTNTATVTTYPPSTETLTSGSTLNRHYTFVITSGSATVGATYTHNSVTYTVIATVSSATQVVMSGSAAPLSSGTLTKASGTGDSSLTFSSAVTPALLKVVCVGGGGSGGGGGNAATPGAGSTGNTTTFGSTLVSCTGGGGGSSGANPSGGACTFTAPAYGFSYTGHPGGGLSASIGTSNYVPPQHGGGSVCFGGGGPASANGAGSAGAANTGGGGGGGSATSGSPERWSMAGGAGGGCGVAYIKNPSATYSYSIAAAQSTVGAAGTNGYAGGGGASGRCDVTFYYQ